MTVKIIQSCEMCGRARKVNHELDHEMGGWRNLNSGSQEATLCSFCITRIVNHALSRAHSRKANTEFLKNLEFWEAQESEQIA